MTFLEFLQRSEWEGMTKGQRDYQRKWDRDRVEEIIGHRPANSETVEEKDDGFWMGEYMIAQKIKLMSISEVFENLTKRMTEEADGNP